jgi:ATP-dependent DNA ligase
MDKFRSIRSSATARVHPRSAFNVFDLLISAGRSMFGEPLWKRREALAKLLRPVSKKSAVIELSQAVVASAQEMTRAITELGLEGIMAKRQGSLYELGKRGSNIKSTKARSLSLVATLQAIPSTR